MQYNNKHYNAIVTKNILFQKSENPKIDKMENQQKDDNQITKKNVQVDRQNDINTSISHLLSPQDQLYLKNLGYSVTLENTSVNFEQVLKTPKYPILNQTHDRIMNSPKNSPLQNETH